MSTKLADILGRTPPAAAPPDSGLRSIPGEPGLPVLGETLSFVNDPIGWGRARYAKYGPVSWDNVFGIRVVWLLGPDAAKVAFTNRDRALSNAGWEYFIGPFFHRGIMLMDFEEHLHHKRIMQQAFTRDRLTGYLGGMNPSIGRALDDWSPSDRFSFAPAIKQLTLDLAADVFMGGTLGAEKDRAVDAFTACVRGGAALLRFHVPGGDALSRLGVPGLRWSRGLAGRRYLEQMFRGQVAGKRAGQGDDLFSVLCHSVTEDGERFSDDDVVNHMIFLLFAAHDTTTITMTTMGYYLAKHPEWQERCRAESLALGKETIDFADLDRLPALDLVLKESLRLTAPVPQVARKAVRDTEILGHFLPKDSYVIVMPNFTHHMAEYWPQPERFDPERFAEHRREDRVHKYAWTPFGSGVHKCIGLHFAGMQIKAVLHQLLQRYRWSVPESYEVELDYSTLPVPKDDLPVRLERI